MIYFLCDKCKRLIPAVAPFSTRKSKADRAVALAEMESRERESISVSLSLSLALSLSLSLSLAPTKETRISMANFQGRASSSLFAPFSSRGNIRVARSISQFPRELDPVA